MEILIILFIILFLLIYFLPSVVAHQRQKLNILAIFFLNLFLGWTLAGWVLALVWAAAHDVVPPKEINSDKQ